MSNDRNCRPLVAASRKYPHHSRCEVELDADVSRLFAPLDDVRRLSAHMEKPSLMMAGAIMHVETDVFEGDGSRFLATHDRARAWYEPGGKGDCHRKGGPLSENLGDTGSAASAGHRRLSGLHYHATWPSITVACIHRLPAPTKWRSHSAGDAGRACICRMVDPTDGCRCCGSNCSVAVWLGLLCRSWAKQRLASFSAALFSWAARSADRRLSMGRRNSPIISCRRAAIAHGAFSKGSSLASESGTTMTVTE